MTNADYYKQSHVDKYDVEFLDTDYIGLLKKTRDHLHLGYELLTHPLYGSVKPYETIYRTIVIQKANTISFTSIELIEEAIETATKFYKINKNIKWTNEILEDFQVVDKDLIDNTLARM